MFKSDIRTAYTTHANTEAAISEIKEELKGFEAKLILYFSSIIHEPVRISKLMSEAFPGVANFGSTTAGEIVSGKMLKGAVVAMAFSEKVLSDVKIEVLEELTTDKKQVAKAFKGLEAHTGVSMHKLSPEEYVGMVLIDGLSGKEELLNERIGDLTNVMFVGGSAGDDLKFEKTHVFANGVAYENAAVLCLIKPTHGFDFIKTQSFQATGKKLTVTKNDEPNRKVYEFNNKPATEAYAEALGVPVAALDKHLFTNPIGLTLGAHDYFVRSPREIDGDGIYFYCGVKENMELDVLSSTEITNDTRKAVDAKVEELGGVRAIVNFHCILRTLGLQQNKMEEAYGKIFENIPTIGLSTYGESYIGHMNQTSTMLVLK